MEPTKQWWDAAKNEVGSSLTFRLFQGFCSFSGAKGLLKVFLVYARFQGNEHAHTRREPRTRRGHVFCCDGADG